MSELDIDNESLPSNDAASPGPSQRHRHHVPFGTLSIQEEDELLSSSQVLEQIHTSQGRYHRLLINHCDLGDARLAIILDALRPQSATTDSGVTSDDEQTSLEHFDWLGLIAPLSASLKHAPRSPYASFRILELDNNNLTSRCLPAICKLLTGNLILHTLSLKANQIGSDIEGFVHLAQALGTSSLRRLRLSSNPILSDSLAVFFDSLPENGISLECLELSNVLHDVVHGVETQTNSEQAFVAAKAIANFIGDSQRCRSLYALLLNGNNLGIRGFTAIALVTLDPFPTLRSKGDARQQINRLMKDEFFSSIFHATWRPSNCTLEVLEVYGNIPELRDADINAEVEKFHRIRQRYASIPVSDIEAIASYLEVQTSGRRMRTGAARIDDLPEKVSRHLSKAGVSLHQCENDFRHVIEIGIGLTIYDQDFLPLAAYGSHPLNWDCRQAAAAILGVARILGCRAKPATLTTNTLSSQTGDPRSGHCGFFDLPLELRLAILRHLDATDVLSANQFSNVISFACDPTTIGYGSPSYDWSRVSVSKPGLPHDAIISASSTLPAKPWRWDECFALRAPPRDWPADVLDSFDAPDRLRQRSHAHALRHAPGQDACYSRASPALYAFLESTRTHLVYHKSKI